MTERKIAESFSSEVVHEGDGVELRRAFPGPRLSQVDPFLLLDELGPTDLAPGAARGFPPHPHRGFETVTYLLAGELQHRDSWGNQGRLRAGDVQWMTAGSGLVHSELPGESLVREGGRLHGFQLWVNLPKRDKMREPRYQDIPSGKIPVATSADGKIQVKVIAGEALGTRGVIETRIPILYLHALLKPGAEWIQPVPRSENTILYVVGGEGETGGQPLRTKHVVLLDRSGDAARIRNTGAGALDLLLVAGEPIGEPVARYGPFVMNSKEELLQAVEDFRSGRMGTIA